MMDKGEILKALEKEDEGVLQKVQMLRTSDALIYPRRPYTKLTP
jgi:hypothetical protein